jgi:hypothetical protein
MTQVNIKKLDSLSHNDTAATKLINDNFQAVQKALEDSLSRKGEAPNHMDADLDMNSKRIINTAEPVSEHDVITKKYFDERVGDAKAFADNAASSAARAESFAKSAAIYSNNAQNVVNNLYNNVDNRFKNYYTKSEIDDKIGNIDTILDEINGEIV